MWIGIDFGTTNTSAAYFDGKQLTTIPLDDQEHQVDSLRSMIYIDSAHRVRLGLDAVQTFLAEDTGREVILEDKFVGTIENTVASQGNEYSDGPITIIYDVVTPEDVGIRGRLLQSIKTALRAAAYRGTSIFGRFYTVEELVAMILRQVRERAQAHLGQPVTQAVIGRPVTFSHDAEVDRLAEEKIRRAAHLAGFEEVEFMWEPIAAAAYFVQGASRTQTVLVFDFGGGTLDLTVLRVAAPGQHEVSADPGQQEVLASVGVLLGGDDLDSAIMRGKVAAHFGAGSAVDVNYDGRPVLFPDYLAELLDQWQTIPTLSRPNHLQVIQRGTQYSPTPHLFRALETLVTKNYGFALFQQIEQAKHALSQQPRATVGLTMEEIQLRVELSRTEFNGLITQEKAQARAAIRQVIAAAGLRPEQIDVVVATGGSSSIPTFQALLQAEVPAAEFAISDLFGSVTGGLAIFAHQRETALQSQKA